MPGLLRRCGELGAPSLVHVISESTLKAPSRLERLLTTCPETTVIALDAFSGSDQPGAFLEIAERHENLYCDLGAMISVTGWIIQRFLDTVGSSRLIFGTDLYVVSCTWYAPAPLFEVLHLDLEPSWKVQILSGNAHRLFQPGTSARRPRS